MCQCRSILRRIKGVPMEPVLSAGAWVERKKDEILVSRWIEKKNVYVKIGTYHVKKCPMFRAG
nr:MAG TPA: hypothetical protein [Caudoviricetes sp.]